MSFIVKIARNIMRSGYHRPQLTLPIVRNNIRDRKDFSTSSKLCVKMFLEHENQYAYTAMKNRGYNMVELETVKDNSHLDHEQFKELIAQDWSQVPPEKIFELFPKLGAYCVENNLCISDTIFDKYIDRLTDSLSLASDEQLVSIFYGLCQWPETESVRTRNYIEVWAALDDTCAHRMHRWSLDQLLSHISLFYMLNVTKGTEFFKKAINKLATKAKHLTPQQIVKTLFFVGIWRKQPFDMHNLEVQLSKNFDSFSVDDLAVMSMGFFKSKTPIRDANLVKKFVELILNNTNTIHEISLAALLKVIRYSIGVPHSDVMGKIKELLDKLTVEVPRLSPMCNVHVALLCCSKLYLHKPCLDAIAQKAVDDVAQLRLKDIERLILSYATLNYTPNIEGFYEILENELRKPEREQEILDHGRTFANSVSYLTLANRYPIDLIDKVLSKDFLKHTYLGNTSYNYGKEILCIHNRCEIFCKGKVTNRLTDKDCTIMGKKYTDFMPNEDFKKQYNFVEKMILEISCLLSGIRGGKEFVIGDHILPHHQRGDLITCDGPNGTPLPIKKEYFKQFGLIRQLPDDNIWTVLVLCGRNGLLHGTKIPTGPFEMKLKELRALGYRANLILWNDYSLLKTTDEKIDYIKEILNKAT